MKRWKDWPALRSPGHPEELPEPERGDHGRLVDVALLDWYLVVALPQVQLAEDAAAMQPGGEVLDVGSGYMSGVVARFSRR